MHTYDNHWFIVPSVRAKNKVLYDCYETARGTCWEAVKPCAMEYHRLQNTR